MKFGIFHEHQVPKPWEEGDELRVMEEALEEAELADRFGFETFWLVEHHFLEEYSHSSAPEVFLAACSQRTRNIRLGHGIVQLPIEYNHTARVAERIATLDLISDGRVEFGTGESSAEAELGGFGVDRATKRAQWSEHLDAVTRMFVEEPFAGWSGEHLQMPERNVVPKPLQKPHPPLWLACSRHETIHLAAEKGVGALSFAFIEPSEARQYVDDYYRILESEQCVPGGFAVNPNIAIVLPFMCHRDEQTAIDRGIDGAHFFGYSLAYYYLFGNHTPGVSSIRDDFESNRSQLGFDRRIAAQTGQQLGAKLVEEGFGSLRGAIGTPDQIRSLLRTYEDVGVDQVIFMSQTGRNRHEHICESLELFASAVMPEFHERDEAHCQRKADRLGPAIERALARRAPPRNSDGKYSFAAAAQT